MKSILTKRLAAVAGGLALVTLWLVVTLASGTAPDAAAQGDDPVETTITVYKYVDTPLDGDTTVFNFTLSSDGQADISFPLSNGQQEVRTVTAGTWTVTETRNDDYGTSIYCSAGDKQTSAQSDTNSVMLTVVEGDSHDCEVRNVDLSFGGLYVEKHIDYIDCCPSGDFDFTLTGPDYSESFTLNNYSGRSFDALMAGATYTLEELAGEAGSKFLTNFVCTDESGAIVAGIDDPDPEVGGGSVGVTIIGGERIRCDVYNIERQGDLTIEKHTSPLGDVDLDFTVTVTGPLVDGSGPVLDTFTLNTDQGSTEQLSNIVPGTYLIEETPVDGWATTIVCEFGRGDDYRSLSFDGVSATIEIPRGEDVYCDIQNSNTASSSIRLTKQIPSNSGFNTDAQFDVTLAGGTDSSSEIVKLSQGSAELIEGLTAGTYTITENVPDGYAASIYCEDNLTDDVVGSIEGPELTVELPAGHRINCSITNTRTDVAFIRVHKELYGDSEGQEQDFAFELTGVAEGFALNRYGSLSFEVPVGSVTLTETTTGDFTTDIFCYVETDEREFERPPALVDVQNSQTVTFTAEFGQYINCDVTNRPIDDGSSITIVKTLAPMVPEDDERFMKRIERGEGFNFSIAQTAGSDDLYSDTFTLYPGSYGSSERYNLSPGSYVISELNPGEYDTTVVCGDGDDRNAPPVYLAAMLGDGVESTSTTVDLAEGQHLICSFVNTDPARAVITVEKDVNPGRTDPTDFTFTIVGPDINETFVLDDDDFSSLIQAQRLFDNLTPGDYTVTETLIPGYETSVACYDETRFGDFGPKRRIERLGGQFIEPLASSQGGVINFSVEGGQTVHCEFWNRVSDATLVVTKDDTGDTGTAVDITVVERGALIASGMISDDGSAPVSMTVPIIAGYGFTVTETVPFGFTADLDAATCIDQTGKNVIRDSDDIIRILREESLPASANVEASEGPLEMVSVFVFGRDIAPGDTITCKLVNNPKPGTITVTKVNTAGDGTDFAFTLTGAATNESFSLDDDADATLSNTATFAELPFGTYTLGEALGGVQVYDTVVVCEDRDGGTIAGQASATIDLDPGETVACTFTNTPVTTGTILVVNDTQPNGPQDFAFSATSVTPGLASALPPGVATLAAGFVLDDDADAALPKSLTFRELVGTHTLSANAVAGFTTTVSCVDPDGGTTVSGLVATIDLDPGETITCTYVHTSFNSGSGQILASQPVDPDADTAAADTAAAAAAAAAAATQSVAVNGGLAVTGTESVPLTQLAFATIGIGFSVIAGTTHRRRRRQF